MSGAQNRSTGTTHTEDGHLGDHNQVRLVGTLSGPVERRSLPSGDELAQLRVVVRRRGGGADTILVQFGPAPASGERRRGQPIGRRELARALRLDDGARVEVHGRLRRRWWAADDVRHSRMEVAAERLVGLPTPSDAAR